MLPYFAAYLRGLGFTGEQIGLVQMLPSLLAPAVAIAWATFADHRSTPQRALRVAAGWAAFAVLPLSLARGAVAGRRGRGPHGARRPCGRPARRLHHPRVVPPEPRRLVRADPALRLARVHRALAPRRPRPDGAGRPARRPPRPRRGDALRRGLRARRARRARVRATPRRAPPGATCSASSATPACTCSSRPPPSTGRPAPRSTSSSASSCATSASRPTSPASAWGSACSPRSGPCSSSRASSGASRCAPCSPSPSSGRRCAGPSSRGRAAPRRWPRCSSCTASRSACSGAAR